MFANPLFIACHLVTPGYVSYWSALHSYGFTEQVPLTVYVATTRKKAPVAYAGQRFRFVTVQPRKFFGYRRELVGGLPVLIADEEKALIDSLGEPEYAGGIAEVAKALRAAIETIHLNTLVEYANRLGDKTLGRFSVICSASSGAWSRRVMGRRTRRWAGDVANLSAPPLWSSCILAAGKASATHNGEST